MIEQFRNALSVPTFARRAFSALNSMAADELAMRKSPGSKAVIEEVLPLAVLLLHLWQPSRSLRCRYVGNKENHDAVLSVRGPEVEGGFLKSRYFVEVTTAAHPEDHLRREALARNGYVHLGGPVTREKVPNQKKRSIVSKAVAVDADSVVYESANWISERIEKKAQKRYPDPCILLVNVEADRPTIGELARIQRLVQERMPRHDFDCIYGTWCSSNCVMPLT